MLTALMLSTCKPEPLADIASMLLKGPGRVLRVTMSDGRVELGQLVDCGPEMYRVIPGIDGRGSVQIAASDVLEIRAAARRLADP
jgi:hypothetical protein